MSETLATEWAVSQLENRAERRFEYLETLIAKLEDRIETLERA